MREAGEAELVRSSRRRPRYTFDQPGFAGYGEGGRVFMKRLLVVLAATSRLLAYGYSAAVEPSSTAVSRHTPPDLPFWAWGWATPEHLAPDVPRPIPVILSEDDGVLLRIPGSRLALRPSLFRRVRGDEGIKEVPDWAPESHAPMPDIVKFGRSVWDDRGELIPGEDGGIRGCGVCHSATGIGRPENAAPAGLPYAYLLQQLEDFRHDLRVTSDPKKENAFRMISYAKLATFEELSAAAEYFASLPYPPSVTVVETAMVPKTYAAGGMLEVLEAPYAGTEPIGERIIEVPEHPELTAIRAPNAGYIAYAPIGSVNKGEALVARGQCIACHGRNLQGDAPGAPRGKHGLLVPPLAGRSPTYIVRQLYDFKKGNRRGVMSRFMTPVVADLNPVDMLNIAAYVGSLAPPPARASQGLQTAVR
jgi:cytochrome c553